VVFGCLKQGSSGWSLSLFFALPRMPVSLGGLRYWSLVATAVMPLSFYDRQLKLLLSLAAIAVFAITKAPTFVRQ
jgi:hypothetical protein